MLASKRTFRSISWKAEDSVSFLGITGQRDPLEGRALKYLSRWEWSLKDLPGWEKHAELSALRKMSSNFTGELEEKSGLINVEEDLFGLVGQNPKD